MTYKVTVELIVDRDDELSAKDFVSEFLDESIASIITEFHISDIECNECNYAKRITGQGGALCHYHDEE